MKRNRRSSVKRERIIMVTSSVLVLTALTMTGLYMRGQEIREQDDGYTLDFTALESHIDDKLDEIAQEPEAGADFSAGTLRDNSVSVEDDLDYMPLEAGSGQVEIPGLTDRIEGAATSGAIEEKPKKPKEPEKKQESVGEPDAASSEIAQPETAEGGEQESKPQETAADENALKSVAAKELHFSDSDTLLRPVSGEILIPYSMDKSVYFATLDQYKYNPATVFDAEEGTVVSACAAGKVVKVFKDAEIGRAVTIDLGDGYSVTYGQLTDIQVKPDNYVEAGDKLGTVAAPTKYYVSEGANLYFLMEKDGTPIDSEVRF